jgi:hypothetical protein
LEEPSIFVDPRIAKYTQAMKNILLQPVLVRAILMVNILTTVFSKIPTDLSERLSPLTTSKSMHHISKNFATAILGANFLRNNLESLNYETNSITILSFVAQNDMEKVIAQRDAEQVARNEREFDFVESHRKAIKATIEGLGKIQNMECIVKICANICCVTTAILTFGPEILSHCSIPFASRLLKWSSIPISSSGMLKFTRRSRNCHIFF